VRKTTVSRKRLPDAETATWQELKDITPTELAGATTRKSTITLNEMLNAIGANLSHLPSSIDEQDREEAEDG
jgi:hypothetical protein